MTKTERRILENQNMIACALCVLLDGTGHGSRDPARALAKTRLTDAIFETRMLTEPDMKPKKKRRRAARLPSGGGAFASDVGEQKGWK